jgi:hypothetical protein
MAAEHQTPGTTSSAASMTRARIAIPIDDRVFAEMAEVDDGIADRARGTFVRLLRELASALTPMRMAVWAARRAKRDDGFVAALEAARRHTCQLRRRGGRFARMCEGRSRARIELSSHADGSRLDFRPTRSIR